MMLVGPKYCITRKRTSSLVEHFGDSKLSPIEVKIDFPNPPHIPRETLFECVRAIAWRILLVRHYSSPNKL